jgi:membrane associated rhomboid family serine protease
MSHEPPPPEPTPKPREPKVIPIEQLLEGARARSGRTDGHPLAAAPESPDPFAPDDENEDDEEQHAETVQPGLWDRIGDVHPGFTYALTLTILLGFALQLVTATVPAARAIAGGSLVGPFVTAGASARGPFLAGEWWRVLSAVFLHANVLHVGSNLLALVILGGVAERAFGHGRFLVLFTLAAAAGSFAGFWRQGIAPTLGSIGASGAVYGVGAAVVVAAFRMRGLLPAWRVRALVGATLPLLLASLAGGFQKPGTDNAAHVGGVVAGALLALVLPFHPKLTGRIEPPSSRFLWGVAGLVAFALTIASGATAAWVAFGGR